MCIRDRDNPHLIATTADLDKVRTHTHTEGNVTTITGYFKLVNDIVFTDKDYQENGAFYNNGWGWTPIGHNNKTSYFSGDQFQGDFNGDDYAVKNIKIERPAGYWYNGCLLYTSTLNVSGIILFTYLYTYDITHTVIIIGIIVDL